MSCGPNCLAAFSSPDFFSFSVYFMIRWMLCARSLTAKRHCCEEQLRLNRHAECSSDGSHWGRPGGKKTQGLGGRGGERGRKVVPSVRFNGRANIVRVGGEQTGVRCGPGQHPDEMKKRGELRCRNVGGAGEGEELPAFAGRRVSSSRHFKHRGVFQSDLLPPPSPPARVCTAAPS